MEYVAGMNRTRRDNDVHNYIGGDVGPDASVIQTGHHLDDNEGPSGAVHNSIDGNVSGGTVIQGGNFTGDIPL